MISDNIFVQKMPFCLTADGCQVICQFDLVRLYLQNMYLNIISKLLVFCTLLLLRLPTLLSHEIVCGSDFANSKDIIFHCRSKAVSVSSGKVEAVKNQ